MKDTFWVYFYAVKYYLQGDSWENAKIFAKYIVKGWHKREDK